jgi:hypothetical protein
MSEVIKTFGNNAGKIYKVLEKEGPQVQTKILEKTKLRNEEFYGALGWLARENKICKQKRRYAIGETNLTSNIGMNAGKVWEILGRSNEIDINAISRFTDLNKNDCYSALGWLAREGKITARISVRKR